MLDVPPPRPKRGQRVMSARRPAAVWEDCRGRAEAEASWVNPLVALRFTRRWHPFLLRAGSGGPLRAKYNALRLLQML